ncbi:type II toxin-antitoxin system VapC family toxin [Leifsonia sp. LS-T14]|uniref:type II toxin-antitoxin system VapC family toxin n=1 Tax=unclassified Leifsonia TaxID=2663824 RepID=UPI0035A716E1
MQPGLLDTSTLILLGRVADPSELPDIPSISALTLAELSVGPLVAKSPEERAARQAHLQLAEADFDPIPFDSSAARAFAQVAQSLRAAGRTPTARAFDALIAATAISRDLPLYTCNPDDFGGIPQLDLRRVTVGA